MNNKSWTPAADEADAIAHTPTLGPYFTPLSKPRKRIAIGGTCVSLSTILITLTAPISAHADDPPTATELKITRMLEVAHHWENLLVRFRPETLIAGRAAAHTAAGAVVVRSFRSVSGLYLVSVPSGNLADGLGAYLGDAQVMYAEPDYLIYPSSCATPTEFPGDNDDTEWGNQYGLNNVGQDIPGGGAEDCGTADADIDAPEAWDVGGADEFTGDPDFRIGVLDYPIYCNHRDFVESEADDYWEPDKSNIWTNLDEFNGEDNCDDDGNGYVDDIHGFNFTQDPPTGSGVCTAAHHGLFVAGIIGARGNNGEGISGVAWRCKLVGLSVIQGEDGTMSNAVEALQYMIDNNIRVSNSSWDFAAEDITSPAPLADMIEAAGKEIGHIFVGSAGNNGYDIDDSSGENWRYPPRIPLGNVIVVAATDKNDGLAGFSNWGVLSVDLGAPGVDAFSLLSSGQNAYGFSSGTSFAAPHVAGVFALVMGKYPTLRWDKVVDRVMDSVRPVVSLDGKTVSGGVVNAAAALEQYSDECNYNGIPDECDIDCGATGCTAECDDTTCQWKTTQLYCGQSSDCNSNGVPDECETDCNDNGIPDACDISAETHDDCNENGILDMCEYPNPTYVDACIAEPGDGSDWENAYDELQTAIDNAFDGYQVFVKEGTYEPITLRNNVAIYGGFDSALSGESEWTDADPATNVTYIPGDGEAKHVVTSSENDASAVLRGFHIKDGNANGSADGGVGGGLLLDASDATIVECVLEANEADDWGGAVASINDGSPTFVNCIFRDNEDGADAGGDIAGGGAFYSESGSPRFHNCLFHDNMAEDGGAVYMAMDGAFFINCTFADNEATSGDGGAIYDTDEASVIRNSILYFNTAAGSGDQIYPDTPTKDVDVTYSDVQGTWPGTGNISGVPLFVNRSTDDYSLLNESPHESPCMDVANNDDLPLDVADLDKDGNIDPGEVLPKDLHTLTSGTYFNARVRGCANVDMGAYEDQDMCAYPE